MGDNWLSIKRLPIGNLLWTLLAIYRNSIDFLYSHFYILSIILPIWTIYTFSIKSHYNYLSIFSILLPITTLYRLTIVSLYRHLYTKYIWIAYNITYKGSLDFGIPSLLLDLIRYPIPDVGKSYTGSLIVRHVIYIIEDLSADLHSTYTMHSPVDIRWDVLNHIMSSHYLHNYRIWELNGMDLAIPVAEKN